MQAGKVETPAVKGAQGIGEGKILPQRARWVFGDPPLQAGGQPGFPLPQVPLPELSSLREGTVSAGLDLMPWRSPCPQPTPLQARPPGNLFLLHKAEPRQSVGLVKPVKPAIYRC